MQSMMHRTRYRPSCSWNDTSINSVGAVPIPQVSLEFARKNHHPQFTPRTSNPFLPPNHPNPRLSSIPPFTNSQHISSVHLAPTHLPASSSSKLHFLFTKSIHITEKSQLSLESMLHHISSAFHPSVLPPRKLTNPTVFLKLRLHQDPKLRTLINAPKDRNRVAGSIFFFPDGFFPNGCGEVEGGGWVLKRFGMPPPRGLRWGSWILRGWDLEFWDLGWMGWDGMGWMGLMEMENACLDSTRLSKRNTRAHQVHECASILNNKRMNLNFTPPYRTSTSNFTPLYLPTQTLQISARVQPTAFRIHRHIAPSPATALPRGNGYFNTSRPVHRLPSAKLYCPHDPQ
ncbi:hypothetical protein BJ508DRAFT_177966 [Ascobolus immersus RN42]|uniref:Uncharacterized protein n=1 Tax=Ascobolus immersus RN42 TaxID=1160509 RepID=A0A3N4IHA7_ASCIM|nr:hypothetical protein BJ508DRAFT_177966 [Ascobolus immersus RN42]